MAKARAARMRDLEKEARFPKDGTLGPFAAVSTTAADGSVRRPGLDATVGASGFASNYPANSPMSGGANETFDGMLPMTILPQSQQAQVNGDLMDQWIVDDATLLQDPLKDESLDWPGWDDMVRDYQMEVQQDQGMERGPVLGGVTGWW